MKKFLVILMVVAMSSFLFVGCLPGTTTPEEEVPVVPVVAKTETPYITWIDDGTGASINLSPTVTQYSSGPEVQGVAVPGSVIKVYIDGKQSGVGYTGAGGSFNGGVAIPVSMITLTEGVKKLYVTATQPGLAESDKSAEYTFTYDETAPKIVSAFGDSTDQTITVTFNEAVDTGAVTLLNSALEPINYELNGAPLAIATATITKISSTVVKIDLTTRTIPTQGGTFLLSCALIDDAVDNGMSALFTESCLGYVTGD